MPFMNDITLFNKHMAHQIKITLYKLDTSFIMNALWYVLKFVTHNLVLTVK